MTLEINPNWIYAIILVSLRFTTLIFATPLDANARIPTHIRLLFTLAISLLLVNALNLHTQLNITTPAELALTAIWQIIIGYTMALGIQLAFASFQIGGKLLDMQMGLAASDIFNPNLNNHQPLWGTILTVLATLIFFTVDGHHLLLKGFAYSFELSPLTTTPPQINFTKTITQAGKMFTYGFTIVAPAVIGLLLIDFVIGVLARTMPQMHVYFLFLPLKIALGILIMALSIPYMLPTLTNIYNWIWHLWTP